MRSCCMQPSLVVLFTLLKSSPATGASNIFQTQNLGLSAGAGSGWANGQTDDGVYIDIPYGCQALSGKKLQDCVDLWYDEYYAEAVIPEECINLSGLDLHNCIEAYKSSISASPSLSASPTLSPTLGDEPPSTRPSLEEIYHTASLPIDVTTLVELPSDSSNPDATSTNVNTDNELQSDSVSTTDGTADEYSSVVYVNEYVELGSFDMSITIYSSHRTNNRRNRILNDDGASFTQEHELVATNYFLQQVYQERFRDQKVKALQLRFTDGGETLFSHGVIRYSSFNGTVGFESATPSEEELESATLNAFVGKTNKATFLELFHSTFAEADHLENVATLYDVTVQKSLANENESTQGVSSVPTKISPVKNSPQTVQDSPGGNRNLILTVICVVVVAVVLLLGSVYFRGRRVEQYKLRSRLTYVKYDDEKVAVEKCTNDEEKRFQYDSTTIVCTSSGNKENDNEEESIQSSLSSNLPDESTQSNFDQPYPLEISSSYLEAINNQSLREHSELKLSQDEQDGNASTTWTFSAVGADTENRSQDGASIGYSVGGISDIIRNMKDFDEMVVSTDPALEVYDEEKGRSKQVDYDDGQLSFLGSVGSTDFKQEDRKQIDSFIKEILSRDDLDADE